jgi:hypothetical protein
VFDLYYLIEILTSKCFEEVNDPEQIRQFGDKYNRVFDLVLGISVPDNPMGQSRYDILEAVEYARLTVFPEKIVMEDKK